MKRRLEVRARVRERCQRGCTHEEPFSGGSARRCSLCAGLMASFHLLASHLAVPADGRSVDRIKPPLQRSLLVAKVDGTGRDDSTRLPASYSAGHHWLRYG